jgi:hypothetical protein
MQLGLTFLVLLGAWNAPASRVQDSEISRVPSELPVILELTLNDGQDGPLLPTGEVSYWLGSSWGNFERTASLCTGIAALEWPEECDSFSIGRVVIDGRDAYCQYYATSIPSDRRVRLEAEWLPTVRLWVRDETGRRYPHSLEIAQDSRADAEGRDKLLPSPDAEHVEGGGTSPLLLLPRLYSASRSTWSSVQRWFVRAPGYEWSFIDIDHSLSGDYHVQLRGACTLVVMTDGLGGNSRLDLTLAKLGSPQASRRLQALTRKERSCTFRSLSPGYYALRVDLDQVGARPAGTRRLVEIRPGAVAQVEIDTNGMTLGAGHEGAPIVPISLSVDLENGDLWTNGRTHLIATLDPSDELLGMPGVAESTVVLSRRPVGNGSQWTGETRAATGHWYLRLPEVNSGASLVVPANERIVAVGIPQPISCRIRCIDEESGLPLGGAAIYCDSSPASDVVFPSAHPILNDMNSEGAMVILPRGALLLHARRTGYLPTARALDVHTGTDLVTLALRKEAGVALKFECDGVPLFAPYDLSIRLLDSHGTEVSVGRRSDQIANVIIAPGSGAYELHVGTYPGYAPVGPIQVAIQPSSIATVVVAMRRGN